MATKYPGIAYNHTSPRSIPTLEFQELDHCPTLEAALTNFYDDPITQEYGANDCDGLIIRNHQAKCSVCRRMTVMR